MSDSNNKIPGYEIAKGLQDKGLIEGPIGTTREEIQFQITAAMQQIQDQPGKGAIDVIEALGDALGIDKNRKSSGTTTFSSIRKIEDSGDDSPETLH